MAGNPTELLATLADIEADPESWDQRRVVHDTGCGTTYCFTGRTLLRKGYLPVSGKDYFADEFYWVRPGDGVIVNAIDEASIILGLPGVVVDELSAERQVLFFRCEVDTPAKMREVVEAVIADDHEVIRRYL